MVVVDTVLVGVCLVTTPFVDAGAVAGVSASSSLVEAGPEVPVAD